MHLILGHAYLGQKDLPKAIAAFKLAKEKAPQDARGYYELGRAYRLLHKDQEALGVFEQALSLDPNQYNALTQIVNIFLTKGATAQAEAKCLQAIALRPQDVSLYLLLATLYVSQNKLQDAEATYRKAMALNPQDIQAPLALGDVYVTTPQLDAALAAYKQAAALAPEAVTPKAKLAEFALAHNRLDDVAKYTADPESWPPPGVSRTSHAVFTQARRLCLPAALAAPGPGWGHHQRPRASCQNSHLPAWL